MRPLDPPIDRTHFATNRIQFGLPKLQPEEVLKAQRALWLTLHVTGAAQKTKAENFLLLGEPFEEAGSIYSQIFNSQILRPYTPPTIGTLSPSDLCPNVKALGPTGLAWQHLGDNESAVRGWYGGIGAEAKDGRVLFNLHYKDAWEALFHEPVHEAAPSGGIGTAPRWIYEGYCEIFAKRLAESMGFTYNIQAGPYGPYAAETQKLIDFTSETYVARAYFTNDEWSYGLLAPLWYKKVMQHDIAPGIATFLPGDVNDVPGHINDLIKPLTRRGAKPEWYRRWVTLFGRSAQMPDVGGPVPGMGGPPPPPGMGGPPPPPGFGGPPPPPGFGGPPPPPGMGVSHGSAPTTALAPTKPFNAKVWAADR